MGETDDILLMEAARRLMPNCRHDVDPGTGLCLLCHRSAKHIYERDGAVFWVHGNTSYGVIRETCKIQGFIKGDDPQGLGVEGE